MYDLNVLIGVLYCTVFFFSDQNWTETEAVTMEEIMEETKEYAAQTHDSMVNDPGERS